MNQKRLEEIEEEIASLRLAIDNDTETAHAIDRNDAWEDIAAAARADGYEEIADIAAAAAAAWHT
jgi:hypothetical protein